MTSATNRKNSEAVNSYRSSFWNLILQQPSFPLSITQLNYHKEPANQSMEAKLLSASSPPSFAVPGATKFSRPTSVVLTSPTREFPIFKLQCPARLSKKAIQSVHAPSNSIETVTKQRVDVSENLTLEAVRYSLIRQEDSIIFSLLERAQYCRNQSTYDPASFSMEGFHGSLVEYMLRETEKLHAQVGRYNSPDEHPFFQDELPDPLLPPLTYPQVK
ncbi:chorismate mutase 1, chloroplastic-like [Hibiscus syriacus]|uniref:chorismate mutase 1, chloroplastic-like n=1 Tax=Hibiscus syriacus TaxID=106335 RepID=UPI001922E9CE|nr:chorismate mutase 1, chloroplastic-like [Hibiscus syriacus]